MFRVLHMHDMWSLKARTYILVTSYQKKKKKIGIYRFITVSLAINWNEKQVTEAWSLHESLS